MLRLRLARQGLPAMAFILAMPLFAMDVPPVPSQFVTDYSGTLDGASLRRAGAALAELERIHGHQVIAVFFSSLDDEALEDFTMRSAEAWRVGRRGLDDGVIFFAFLAQRRMRLEIGYGLEGAIPDAVARRLLDRTVRPVFAGGDYAGGVVALADALGKIFSGAPAPPPRERRQPIFGLVMLLIILIALVVLLSVAGSASGPPSPRVGRRRPSWGTGMGGFGGGYSGGGFGGTGGFGGFSPGGGGFGGGGASGSW